MSVESIILAVISVLLTILSLCILIRNMKNPIHISLFVMIIGAAIWVISNGLDYVYLSVLLTKSIYLGALLIAVGFLFFSFYFPFRQRRYTLLLHILIIIPIIILVLLLYTGDLFIEKMIEEGRKILYGPVFHIFNSIFLIYWFWGIYNFVMKYKVSDGFHKWQIKNLFFAIAFSFVAGIITNMVLPWMFNIWTLGWVGPMFSIVFFGFISYILFKKNI